MSTPSLPIVSTVLVLAFALGASGCTAVRAGLQIQDAVRAQGTAAGKEAGEFAPYEYAMAGHYLHKAWEEVGHGEHKTSVLLARKSIEWSEQAVAHTAEVRDQKADDALPEGPLLSEPRDVPELNADLLADPP